MNLLDSLLATADEMAAAAASLNTPQSYTQFIEARERMKRDIEKLKNNAA